MSLLLGLFDCASATPAVLDTDAASADPALQLAPALEVAANDPSSVAPLDATPSPDGSRIYYLAIGSDGAGEAAAGVFTVAPADSPDVTELALGAPLLTPVGIAISLDGQSLFVADAASGPQGGGGLFQLAASGGTPIPIDGTEGYRPAGVTVSEQQGQSWVYFTGRAPDTDRPGLFRLMPSGGTPQLLAELAASNELGGVAVASNGDAYVPQRTSEGARVLRVRDAEAQVVAEQVALGFPAGIALNRDDTTLLVSGLDPTTKRDVVYVVDVASLALTRMTRGVGDHHEAAGLHRAHTKDVFAWADSEANDTGTVYTVTF